MYNVNFGQDDTRETPRETRPEITVDLVGRADRIARELEPPQISDAKIRLGLTNSPYLTSSYEADPQASLYQWVAHGLDEAKDYILDKGLALELAGQIDETGGFLWGSREEVKSLKSLKGEAYANAASIWNQYFTRHMSIKKAYEDAAEKSKWILSPMSALKSSSSELSGFGAAAAIPAGVLIAGSVITIVVAVAGLVVLGAVVVAAVALAGEVIKYLEDIKLTKETGTPQGMVAYRAKAGDPILNGIGNAYKSVNWLAVGGVALAGVAAVAGFYYIKNRYFGRSYSSYPMLPARAMYGLGDIKSAQGEFPEELLHD